MLQALQREIDRLLLGIEDDEAWLEALVACKLAKADEILQRMGSDPTKLGVALAALAQAVLGAAADRAARKVQARFGIPSYRDNTGQYQTAQLAVVAMGKFGAGELLPEGDLDVLFLYSHWGETRGRTPLSNQEYFARLSQGIMALLAARSRSGFLYRMDTALRPSGNAGVLVTSEDAFIHYHHHEAAAWERLSLIRARPVVGEAAFQERIRSLLSTLVYDPPVPEGLAREIVHLRGRMEREISQETPDRIDIKLGPGGIVDIEFAVQFLQIRMGKLYPDLRTHSTFQAIDALGRRGLLKPEAERLLSEAYHFFLRVEAVIRSKSLASTNVLARHSMTALETAQALGLDSARTLTARLDDLRSRVRALFVSILNPPGSL